MTLSKYLIGVAAGGLMIVLIIIGFHLHDQRVAERAAAHARIARDSATLVVLRDSLRASENALSASQSKAAGAIAGYDSARKAVRIVRVPGVLWEAGHMTHDTLRIRTTDTVKVLGSFIEAADSMRQACQVVMSDCQRFRLHADSALAAQERIISDLKTAEKAKGPGFLSKVGRTAIIFGAGYLAGRVF